MIALPDTWCSQENNKGKKKHGEELVCTRARNSEHICCREGSRGPVNLEKYMEKGVVQVRLGLSQWSQG